MILKDRIKQLKCAPNQVLNRVFVCLFVCLFLRLTVCLWWPRYSVNVKACSSAVLVLLGTPDPCGHRSAQQYLQQEPRMPGSGRMWAGVCVGKDLSPCPVRIGAVLCASDAL